LEELKAVIWTDVLPSGRIVGGSYMAIIFGFSSQSEIGLMKHITLQLITIKDGFGQYGFKFLRIYVLGCFS